MYKNTRIKDLVASRQNVAVIRSNDKDSALNQRPNKNFKDTEFIEYILW